VSQSAEALPHKVEPSRRLISIRPTHGFSLDLGELWRYRELLYILAWRDVKVRYKQTALGVLWAILQPVAAMLVFTVVFGRVSGIRPEGIPYPVFLYAGLAPWTYFAASLTQASTSLVGNTSLVTKVYFPRLLIPLGIVLVPLVDFLLAFLVLVGMMVGYGVTPNWHLVTLPLFLVLALVTALGIGLLLSAVNVRYRDVPYAIPFLMQVWMFASPVIYHVSFLPERWRWLLSLNPMTGVIEGFRWALIAEPAPDWSVLGVSIAVAFLTAAAGLVYFRRMERHFADLI
jgi:lipopolysaccharide transport system permease protein